MRRLRRRLPLRGHRHRASTAEPPASSEARGVWIFAEQRQGVVHGVAFELLAEGRQLALMIGCDVTAVLLRARPWRCPGRTDRPGGRPGHCVGPPDLALFHQETYADLLATLAAEHRPEIMLCGATSAGRSFFPRTAARLGTGLTADCTELAIDPEKRLLLQTRPAFGGNIMATIICPATGRRWPRCARGSSRRPSRTTPARAR